MLGQPASSQTVCSPSRRTSDFSSVYSGPVFSLVLIHSGLRSIGVWLFRTSRRSSLRPAGSMLCAVPGVLTAASLMASTLLPPAGAPRAPTNTGAQPDRLGPRVGVVRDGSARAVLVGPGAPGRDRLTGGAGGLRATLRRRRGHGSVRVVVRAAGRLGSGQVALVLRAGGRLLGQGADVRVGRRGVRGCRH